MINWIPEDQICNVCKRFKGSQVQNENAEPFARHLWSQSRNSEIIVKEDLSISYG